MLENFVHNARKTSDDFYIKSLARYKKMWYNYYIMKIGLDKLCVYPARCKGELELWQWKSHPVY